MKKKPILITIIMLIILSMCNMSFVHAADTAPPQGVTVTINDDDEYTKDDYVTLDIYAQDESAMKVWVSNDGATGTVLDFATNKTINITDTSYTVGTELTSSNSSTTTNTDNVLRITNWPIENTDGTKKVLVVFSDAYGNISSLRGCSTIEVTFDLNDKEGIAVSSRKTVKGLPIDMPAATSLDSAYEFIGWTASETATIASYTVGTLYSFESSITLYAVWGDVINVDGLGNIGVSDPNAELTYDPDTGDLGGAVPPAEEPETPVEIPEEKLPEMIEFGYGNFESKTSYTPGTYETVEYETTYTNPKYPVSYQNVVWSEWNITKDAEGNVVSTEPGDIELADIGDQYSTYIVYDFETTEALETNGVKGDSVELWTIFSASEDTLENAVYLAAYLNRADGKTTRHIAMWDGSQYVAYDADAQISAVDTFTETYTVTQSKQVQITAPSSSTEYVYIPIGTLKAEKGMTWAKWLASDYNTTGETEVTIKTSDYVDVSNDAVIVAGEEYGFAVSESYYIDSDSNKKVYILSDSEITNSNQKTSDNIEEVLQAEGETTQVPVPTGFTYYLGTGDTGLVVKDASGNEFVWIPVNLTAAEETAYPDRTLISDMYGTGTYTLAGDTGVTTSKYGKHNLIGSNSSYAMETPGTTSSYREPDLVTTYDTDTTYLGKAGFSTATELANDLVTEFNNMITSVEKYGGFYVGRYELGYDSGVVCKPGVTALTASTSSGTNYYGSSTTSSWYGLYKASKTFTQGGVTSSMIWGTQWDAMVNFIGDHTATAPSSRYLTGASEYNDKYKNVYDTSTGTVREWTATADNTGIRAYRGGGCSNGYASSYRYYSFASTTSSLNGTRTQLYIKN